VAGIAQVGVPAANEADDLAVVDDREHDAVAEPVDETAGAGNGGHSGGGHFIAGDSAAAEMINQSGPAGRGLAGPEAYVIGQVLAEPVGQILVSPGGRKWLRKKPKAIWLISIIRSRLIGHSCHAIARVNIRSTSASLCSWGPL
jgi:hypothetical protein